jgi:excinuclease ABC subunit A
MATAGDRSNRTNGADLWAHGSISVRGAKEHNLKDIDVDIPRQTLTVITGLSGSGKSSLAFDTIYAEGQRRYVESLSAYARQFLELMQKPDVESIEGLSPAISIEQKTTSKNPRSTVGTVTEIYDYLRLLFARIGIPIRRPPACRSRARRSARWSTASWPCRRARGSICWRRSCAAARASTRRNCRTCSGAASSACGSTASCTRSTPSPPSTRS